VKSSLKVCHPTPERKCLVCKGEFGSRVYGRVHIPRPDGGLGYSYFPVTDTTSLKLYVLFDRGLFCPVVRGR
jgi:hypothetical protein